MDPLVMYWNRDMITAAGFVSPPETWSDIQAYINAITEVDKAQNIDQSAVALGTANNINKFKATLSSMFMQAGNPVTSLTDVNYQSVLADNSDRGEAALRLYTQFANPAASSYTWNNTFNSDRQSFISNNLGMYFDTGQEITEIREQNPNLNFDVAQIPQRENQQPRTYARMYGVALLSNVDPRRQANVFSAMRRLVSRPLAQSLLKNTNLTPVRTSLVANASPDSPQKQVFLNTAPTARAWADPNPEQTDQIFNDMITGITSGQTSASQALSNAHGKLQNLLESQQEE
jgi:multiple sugar transport system substrate-binding protein